MLQQSYKHSKIIFKSLNNLGRILRQRARYFKILTALQICTCRWESCISCKPAALLCSACSSAARLLLGPIHRGAVLRHLFTQHQRDGGCVVFSRLRRGNTVVKRLLQEHKRNLRERWLNEDVREVITIFPCLLCFQHTTQLRRLCKSYGNYVDSSYVRLNSVSGKA